MKVYVQGLAKATEEVEYKFGSTVGDDIGWNTMLGEYVKDKEFGQLNSYEDVIDGNEDALFCKLVDDNQDGCETRGGWKFFDKVHGYGVPWRFWNWKRFEEAVWLVMTGFGLVARDARVGVVFDEILQAGPDIFMTKSIKVKMVLLQVRHMSGMTMSEQLQMKYQQKLVKPRKN